MLDKKDVVKLIDALELSFATKKDFQGIKDDIFDFKSEVLTGVDKILGEVKALRQEKTVGDDQDKRQKKVFEIHNAALKTTGLLCSLINYY